MPASASERIAASRRAGAAARGSIARASVRSSVVTERAAAVRPFSAIGARISISRSIRADLVTMVTGWLQSASTFRISRVIRRSRSTG